MTTKELINKIAELEYTIRALQKDNRYLVEVANACKVTENEDILHLISDALVNGPSDTHRE